MQRSADPLVQGDALSPMVAVVRALARDAKERSAPRSRAASRASVLVNWSAAPTALHCQRSLAQLESQPRARWAIVKGLRQRQAAAESRWDSSQRKVQPHPAAAPGTKRPSDRLLGAGGSKLCSMARYERSGGRLAREIQWPAIDSAARFAARAKAAPAPVMRHRPIREHASLRFTKFEPLGPERI